MNWASRSRCSRSAFRRETSVLFRPVCLSLFFLRPQSLWRFMRRRCSTTLSMLNMVPVILVSWAASSTSVIRSTLSVMN